MEAPTFGGFHPFEGPNRTPDPVPGRVKGGGGLARPPQPPTARDPQKLVLGPKVVKNGIVQRRPRTLLEGKRGICKPLWARFDLNTQSNSPTLALLGAIGAFNVAMFQV